jgi:hypothetical protein
VGTGFIGDLAPDVFNADKDIILLVEVEQNFVILVYRDHPVIQTFTLGFWDFAVPESPGGIGNDGVEEDMPHGLSRSPDLGQLISGPIVFNCIIGIGRRFGGGLLYGRFLHGGLRGKIGRGRLS